MLLEQLSSSGSTDTDLSVEEVVHSNPPIPGVHRPPPPVKDGSGDPDRIYYIPPPDDGKTCLWWVVWCSIKLGIYDNWPVAKSQIDNISFATHQKFKHPVTAWEAYELACLSNLVHKLPYHPPLVQAASPPNTPPNPLSQPSNPSTRTRHQHQEPKVWVPFEDQDQPGL